MHAVTFNSNYMDHKTRLMHKLCHLHKLSKSIKFKKHVKSTCKYSINRTHYRPAGGNNKSYELHKK